MSTRTSAPIPPPYTTQEAAAAMRCHLNTVYRMIKTGQLRAVRVGRTYRIPASALAAYVQTDQPVGGGAGASAA